MSKSIRAIARNPLSNRSRFGWGSGVGIGGIPIINGTIVEFSSLEVGERIPHRLKGLQSPHRPISFFELLGTYVGIMLGAPSLLGNNDLTWLVIPIVADNLGNDSPIWELYTSSMPTSWVLQELAAHSLATNTAIASNRMKGDSGKRPILAGELSRDVSTHVNGEIYRVPDWEGPKFWLANLKGKSPMWLWGFFLLKAKSAYRNHSHLKGGPPP